jgi:hypothetical protein
VKRLFPEELRAKHWFETKVVPLPDAGDFRVALGDEESCGPSARFTVSVQASPQVASQELCQLLYRAVTHMSERLKAYEVTEEGVENKFHDTVVLISRGSSTCCPSTGYGGRHHYNTDRMHEQTETILTDYGLAAAD